MLNQVILVGRLTTNLELKEEGEKKLATLTLAIPRNFKNADGEYDTDFITCVLWNAVAENTAEYCKKGDIVGIKGKIQSSEDGKIQIIAERVTFMSSRSEKKEDEGSTIVRCGD